VFRKKPTYVFDYNFGVSWSIFILFVPVEIGINTLQFTYLQSWWRHNCVTLRVTKVYFNELLLNTKYVEFELSLKIKSWTKNLWKCERFSARRLIKKIVQKNKKMNIRRLSAKVANNRFDRMHSRKRSATVVSKCDVFTLGSIVWCCKFCRLLCKVFILVFTSLK